MGIRESELGVDDPSVLWTSDTGPGAKWDILNPRFSRFALQWGVYSALFESKYGAVGSTYRVDTSRLFAATTLIPFPELPIFGGAFRFRAAEDVIVQEQDFDGTGACDYIMIGALSRGACEWAMSLTEVDWDSRPAEPPRRL